MRQRHARHLAEEPDRVISRICHLYREIYPHPVGVSSIITINFKGATERHLEYLSLDPPQARGARQSGLPVAPSTRDHPRMRGEHLHPPVRLSTSLRIIPACAGSTNTANNYVVLCTGSSPHARGALATGQTLSCPARDHPRMRGEHEEVGDRVLVGRGIIPACAGSTPHSHWAMVA